MNLFARTTLRDSLAPSVRLAMGGPPNALLKGLGSEHALRSPQYLSDCPALLVSYVYLDLFLKAKHLYQFRDWVLDSGAFSAKNSGKEIKLENYIARARALIDEHGDLTEVYSLDVIGDWRATLKNTELMWQANIKAIPCFHYGEPEDALKGLAADYPKIALGGAAYMKMRPKMRWAAQCFGRVWPKRIHGFGFGSERSLMELPFHSVDASSWELGPCKFGRWKVFGNMSVRGSDHDLRAEVEWYLDLERKARRRWEREMKLLSTLPSDVLQNVY